MARNPLIRSYPRRVSKPLPNKSAGILDDFAVRRNIDTNAGKVHQVPTDEKDIVNKEYVDSIATRSEIDLFLTENASDIGGYFDLETDVVIATKENIEQTITAGSTTLIAAFASILNEGEIDAIRLLESGIYALHIHAETNFNQGMSFYFEFYHRTSGGTETLLGTSHDSPILDSTEREYDIHASITSDKSFVEGDRIVAKVYGRNTGAANKTITIYMEGETATRVEFPGFVSLGNFVLKSGDTMTGDLSVPDLNMTDDPGLLRWLGVNSSSIKLFRAGDGTDARMDFNVIPADGTSTAEVTFFRETNTTGSRSFVIKKGDGTNTDTFRIDASTGEFTFGGGNLSTLNTITATGTVTAAGFDASTNRITDVVDPTDDQDAATKKYVDDNAGGDLVDDTTPQLGGPLDCQAHSIGGQLQEYTGDGTTTFVFNNGQMIFFTFGAQNDVITLTAPSEPGVFIVFVKQDGTGSRTWTLPSHKTPGSTPIVLSTGGDAVDLLSFIWNGTDWTIVPVGLDTG